MSFYANLFKEIGSDLAEALRNTQRDLKEFIRYRIFRDKDKGYLLLFGGQLLGFIYYAFVAWNNAGFATVYVLALLGALYLGPEKQEPDIGLPMILVTLITIAFFVLMTIIGLIIA